MKIKRKIGIRTLLLFAISILVCPSLQAQSLLQSTVTIKVNKQPLHDILTIISNEANVTFSYNTKAINRDSLVTVQALNKPLGDVLRTIFGSGYEFKESGSYIIIRKKPVSTSSVVSKVPSAQDHYYITGRIIDDETGEGLADATVYEKQQLLSSFTDDKGNFSLRLKTKYPEAKLSISKDGFLDTSLTLQPRYNQKIQIALHTITPEVTTPILVTTNAKDSDYVFNEKREYDIIEEKWLGKLLLSSKQKIQSLNLKKFYTTRAYQFSLVPGISTHGKMNSQVISNTSVNIFGGYSGGVKGFEIGGLFNMIHENVSYVEVGGLFNLVGGKVDGVQLAGLYNDVNKTVDGIQVAGLANRVHKRVKGLQMASLVNMVGTMDGLQLSGLINLVRNEVNGTQLAGLYNHAGEVHGVQIGFINHTSSYKGTSVGFLNISKSKKGKTRVGFLVRVPRA